MMTGLSKKRQTLSLSFSPRRGRSLSNACGCKDASNSLGHDTQFHKALAHSIALVAQSIYSIILLNCKAVIFRIGALSTNLVFRGVPWCGCHGAAHTR